MRVIIIDDDVEFIHLLKLSLQMGFYEKAKRLAKTGRQVTESLEVDPLLDCEQAQTHLERAARPVDLIFLSVDACGAEGLEFIRRNSPAGRRYKRLVAMADRSRRESAIDGLRAGADAYLLKPFGPEALLEHLSILDGEAT